VLSPVGLIPGYAAGADVAGLVAGARSMAERSLAADIHDSPAFWGGAAQYLLARRGLSQSVQLPYYERLDKVTSWYRQLWAESLGKLDADGAHRGLTPVRAMGATDQHSQLQLYLQGPRDKQFTLYFAEELARAGGRVPEDHADLGAVAPLAGHTMGELLKAEFQATRETLTRQGCPNRTLGFDRLTAGVLGELIMLLELETVVVAELMGVDPFDQPAVEEGKHLAREYLARMRD
jgi:glucose-6-phosphate isomerase